MKIFVVGSRSSYGHVPLIREELERAGHKVTPPNNVDDPAREGSMKAAGLASYAAWKAEMLALQASKVAANEAVLVLNFEKDEQQNYLGGATFLEVFKAWELQKKIFFYNPLPAGVLHDELLAMNPVVINGNLSQIS